MKLGKYVKQEPLALQLAPFIDVILFLLTFFLLTWNVSRYEAELSVSLPVAEEGETSTRIPGEILINVSEDGEVIINRRTLTPDELFEILNEVSRDFPDQAVILRADAKTDYQNVASVIDVCKKANVWNIAFSVTRPDEP